jgi:mannose-1-phosphate guanylyltransferase
MIQESVLCKILITKGEKTMKALFLAGGMGTRLKPLTDHLPKPMVPIMVKPLLERNILKLKDCGVDEIILSTCYKSQLIEDYFGDGTKMGMKVHYINEETPLGTGGAIKSAEKFFNETFIVFNADILCAINFSKMISFHKEKKASVTIAITKVENPSAYGVIEYDKNFFAESFTEKPEPSLIKSNYINAGIYIFEPDVLKEIPESKKVSIERQTYPLLLEKGYPIAVFKSDDYWMDIGTIEKYTQAHKDILSGACPFPELSGNSQEIFIGANSSIHQTVKIIAPVYIGENTKIGAFSTIGPNTVIGNNCMVGINCVLSEAIIWDKIRIPDSSIISSTVVISNAMMLKKNHSEKIADNVS